MSGGLTRRQADVLRTLIVAFTTTGRWPGVRELCGALGVRSPGTLAAHLAGLRRKGYVGAGCTVLRGVDGRAFVHRKAIIDATSGDELVEYVMERTELHERLRGRLAASIRGG